MSRKLISAAALLLFAASSLPAQTAFTPVRTRCGNSGAYTDSKGNVWAPDFGFNGGTTYRTSNTISGTPDPFLYHTERVNTPHLIYTFTVPNGAYQVNVLLAEIYLTGAGQRVMNIALQGTPVFTGIDIFKEVGGFAADSKSADTTVTNGTLVIDMTATVNSPKCAAIEILPGSPPPPPVQQTIPLTMAFPGSGAGTGFTLTVPGGTAIPQCNLSTDGNCTVTLQITDCNGNPATAVVAGCAVTLSIMKSAALPTPQTQTTILATVSSP
jgi:hypothetical protein